MLRQAVRKAPRKSVRKPIKRAAAKKRVAAKRTSTPNTTPIFAARMKTFVNNLGKFVDQRKKHFTTKDPIYKRLNAIHTKLTSELKKKNILNPMSAKHLKSLTPALRGVSKLPANVKGQVGKLMIFIRAQVNKDVLALMKHFKGLLTPLQTELNKLNTRLLADIKKANAKKIQWKVDPSLRTRINAINTRLNRYRTKWFNRLNKVNLHGNAQVKAQVRALKKQIDEIQRTLRKNQTIISRYAKKPKARKGFTTKALMTAGQMKTLESKMNNIDTVSEKARMKVEHFWDQLKAIKLF